MYCTYVTCIHILYTCTCTLHITVHAHVLYACIRTLHMYSCTHILYIYTCTVLIYIAVHMYCALALCTCALISNSLYKTFGFHCQKSVNLIVNECNSRILWNNRQKMKKTIIFVKNFIFTRNNSFSFYYAYI